MGESRIGIHWYLNGTKNIIIDNIKIVGRKTINHNLKYLFLE